MLTARGIPADTIADDAGGAAPHVALGSHGFAVAVPDDRAEEAEALLHDAATSPTRLSGWRRMVVRVSAVLILLTVVVAFVYGAML